MFDRFTNNSKRAMSLARDSAGANGSANLDVIHLLVGCCQVNDSIAAAIVAACGADVSRVRSLAQELAAGSKGTTSVLGALPFTLAAKRVLEFAVRESAELRDTAIGTQHLLLGILRVRDDASALLTDAGVTLERARQECIAIKRAPSRENGEDHLDSQAAALVAAAMVCLEAGERDLAAKLHALIEKLKAR